MSNLDALPFGFPSVRGKKLTAAFDGGRQLTIEPGPGLHICGHIALAHFGPLDWSGVITSESFVREIAPSRSFGRFTRAIAGRAYGFAARKPFLQGCGPRSAALLVRGHVIGGLRAPGEPVRHRILDVFGDLAFIGHPVAGRITATHPGHELNHALAATLRAVNLKNFAAGPRCAQSCSARGAPHNPTPEARMAPR